MMLSTYMISFMNGAIGPEIKKRWEFFPLAPSRISLDSQYITDPRHYPLGGAFSKCFSKAGVMLCRE